jgi:hypothetical protein
LFVIAHAGKDQFGRLGCGPAGLAARWLRRPRRFACCPVSRTRQLPPLQRRSDPPGASPAYFEASSQISAQLFEMVAAWERKTLAGFVEPYAPDVIL